MKQFDKNEKQTTTITWWKIFIPIVAIWLFCWYYLIYHFNGISPKAGLFGDMFGVVNSLFSGLAFGGVIYTILLQRNELRLQRQEFAQSVKSLEKSQIERIFLNLLEDLNNTSVYNVAKQGYQAVNQVLSSLLMSVLCSSRDVALSKIKSNDVIFKDHSRKWINEFKEIFDNLKPYSAKLKFLIDYVEEKFEDSEKDIYYRILFSQRGRHEQYFLKYMSLRNQNTSTINDLLRDNKLCYEWIADNPKYRSVVIKYLDIL